MATKVFPGPRFHTFTLQGQQSLYITTNPNVSANARYAVLVSTCGTVTAECGMHYCTGKGPMDTSQRARVSTVVSASAVPVTKIVQDNVSLFRVYNNSSSDYVVEVSVVILLDEDDALTYEIHTPSVPDG